MIEKDSTIYFESSYILRRPQIFCEISTADLSYVVTVKSTVEILQNFVAFSEYMNFKGSVLRLCVCLYVCMIACKQIADEIMHLPRRQ